MQSLSQCRASRALFRDRSLGSSDTIRVTGLGNSACVDIDRLPTRLVRGQAASGEGTAGRAAEAQGAPDEDAASERYEGADRFAGRRRPSTPTT